MDFVVTGSAVGRRCTRCGGELGSVAQSWAGHPGAWHPGCFPATPPALESAESRREAQLAEIRSVLLASHRRDIQELEAIRRIVADAVVGPLGSVFAPTHLHLKSGRLYQVTGTRINATNAVSGQVMVDYQNEAGDKFCRARAEFEDGRFALLADGSGQQPVRPAAAVKRSG